MMHPRESPLLLCASQELTVAIRSRWTQIFAATFAVLALAVAGSGYVLSGGTGVQDFARTATSLTQLVLLVIPMMALLVGATSFSPERGAAELLFSQPLARATIVTGKLLGLLEALVAAQALGFGAAGLVIFSQSGTEGVGGFALLCCGSIVLTAIFLAVSACIAGGDGRRRTRALALAVVIWFAAVVLFDVAALGIASLLRSGPASRVLMVAVLINPVDAVRTGALLGIQGTAAFGAASLALLRFTGGPVRAGFAIAVSLTAWTVVPAALAARRANRTDI
jgi:Cu-processing system permease protein